MGRSETVCIGISSNFFHADPQRPLFKGMALQFFEERMALMAYRAGAIPMGLPDLKDPEGARAVIDQVDGLLLAGGADLSPRSYGQEPIDERWQGDAIRDAYEIRLVEAARARGIPIFGICRGAQLINVALGGTLYQDIITQRPDSLLHRDWEPYDALGHAIRVDANSWLGRVYEGATELEVNSVHHQGIDSLAAPLRATAWAPDGVIEAVEHNDMSEWIAAVQWHPEWLEDRTGDTRTGAGGRASGDALMASFIEQCRTRAARI